MSSAFDAIMGAQSNRRGNGAKKGRYKLRIEKMFEKHGYKGHSFIVEARVIEATQTDPKEPSSAVGSSVSFVMKLSKDGAGGDAAKGNAKDITMAVMGSLGYGPADITKERYEKGLSTQFWKGVDCYVESYDTTIQTGANAGKPFTGYNWTAIPQTAEDVKRQRAQLEVGSAKVDEAKPTPPQAATKTAEPSKSNDLDTILGL